ncbi:transcription factor HES-5-like [Danio aesculapii]|uniref:hairy and enhancer of split-related 15, tandem duplicate 1 n=1 Tax=Danio aesculapii TaxID=1142201 RepID=UPI0024C04B15|nr:hairy and enhancer of split-related 15, tandem duplicate 1 [Danio aesculapii]XP_056324415.1 transcription factor HES-5-like [Danio aesculapii]
MAPAYMTEYSKLSNKEKHKLRKPVVEKMRRDRINNCIEQLKSMLEKEFQQQDPNTKLEKADILEMTVVFLKQQLQPKTPQKAQFEGYSQCWRETISFLSVGSKAEAVAQHLQQEAQRSEAPEVKRMSPAPHHQQHTHIKQEPRAHSPLWRPW